MPPAAEGDGLHTETQSDEELEKEFEELIRTRYKNAYRKRTEGIIRKRLRSVKKEPSEETKQVNDLQSVAQDSELPAEDERKKLQLEKNKSRPAENGVGTSVGMYSKANVSKFTGKEIREILRRADKGEKIRFN